MLELMQEIDAALDAETTPIVGLWMDWMGIVFLASILFAWKRIGARLALLVVVLTMLGANVIYVTTGNVHLFGIAHLIFWAPLLYFLVTREIRVPNFKAASPYGIWLLLISATIVISLVFDVRDIFLVSTGQK